MRRRNEGRRGRLQAGPVVVGFRSLVPVKMALVHPGSNQRVTLEIDRLALVCRDRAYKASRRSVIMSAEGFVPLRPPKPLP